MIVAEVKRMKDKGVLEKIKKADVNFPLNKKIKLNSDKVDNKDYLFKSYYKDVNRYPLLERDEEERLARLAKEGDLKAKEKLINSNLRFVVSIAKKYQNKGLSMMDLIAEGNVGLLNAIEKFDPDRGYHFISYAVWWIRQAILKAISEKTRMVRLPLNKTNELIHIERYLNKNEDLGINPNIDKISEDLSISKDSLETILTFSKEFISLEEKISDNSDSSLFYEFIPDNSISPEEESENLHVKETINNILNTLTEREREVIMYRFGLYGGEPLSLQEIGNKFNLTKERIRQIEKKALRKLKHPTRIKKLKQALAA
ncbi:MAG: RNA polymerase sigma factor RpoD/SigA [Spirochaetes bacterium]|nr:RNA polymerase sigma factor RpoD/SigA [Spirochaetota bacterium]